MMEKSAHAGVSEVEGSTALQAQGVGQPVPPTEFVHDKGQMLTGQLRDRAVEEDRRRFIAALRSLGRAA